MSGSQTVSITCPKCGNVSTAEVWTSVNNVESPDVAQWLIDGFLFQHECPTCNHVVTLNHDCLYHDARRKVMVLYVADPAKAESAFAQLEERLPEGYYARLAFSRDELREKAAILRDDLDDRAVEVAKQAVLNRFVGTGQVDRDARALYGALDEDGGIIVEFVTPAGATETTIGRDIYEGIVASFTEEQPAVIDRIWAMNVLSNWE